MPIRYKPEPMWQKFYSGDWDEAVMVSGRGFGKSWHCSNFVTLQTLKDFEYRTLLARDVGSSINQSILETIKARFLEVDAKTDGIVNQIFDIQESQIKKKKLDEGQRDVVNVITKGFRTSRVDQKADLKGFEDMDLAVLEEAQDIRDENRVRMLFDTLKKPGNKKIIMLNTPDLEHWVVQRYFDYEPTDYKGFYRLVPKKIDRVCIITGDFTDNGHLDAKTAQIYRDYGNKDSYRYDLDYYLGEILGYAKEKQHLARKFDLDKVLALAPRQPLQIIDSVKIFTMPEPKQIYVMGIDPSSGLGGDFTAISVRNFYTGQLVAQMKSKATELETAKIAVNLANFLETQRSKCYIACEVNGLGRAVQTKIQESWPSEKIYKKYIQDPTKQFDTLVPDYGWETTSKNRDLIINEFANAFALDQIEVVNEDEIEEMRNFIWKTDKNDARKGRYEAQENSNDDLLFADMICLAAFDFVRQYG